MPEEYKDIKDSRVKWQPKRLSFKEGLQEVPIPAFVIYGIILVALLVLEVIALRVLPSQISVDQMFGLYKKEFPTLLFLAMLYGVEVYLIYRDIIRRSMAKTLCVIPLMFFWLSVYIILFL